MINQKISVVISVYNAEFSIIQCIESVLLQTVPLLEIIVINDGSTDRTEVCLDFKNDKQLNILKVITQENMGPSRARNSGISHSMGDWIAFLDSDDKWLPDKIEKQLNVLEIYPKTV